MKNIKLIAIFLISFFIGISVANASATLSVNRNTIEVGQSVTATVRVTGAGWDIRITGTGSTPGCSDRFVDDSGTGRDVTRNLTITCRSNSIGTINFTISGLVAPASGGTRNISGSRSVTVTPVIPKSPNNNLASLSVNGFELTPAFDKEVLEYSVSVPPNTDTVTIEGTREQNNANVEGLGSREVKEGLNRLEIKVTAQNGDVKTYIINVTVEEADPIIVTVNGRTFWVVRQKDSLTMPEGFDETTVMIDDEEVPAFYSEITKITLVGLRDEDDNIALFIYNEKDGSFIKYNEVIGNGIILSIMISPNIPKRFTESTCLIGGLEVTCYIYNESSDFVLVYGMNMETGETGFYIFDKKYETLQRYNEGLIKELEKTNQQFLIITGIFGVGLLISTIALISISRKKKPKKMKKTIEKPQLDPKDEETPPIEQDKQPTKKQ